MQNPEIYIPDSGKYPEKIKKPFERIADRAIELIRIRFSSDKDLAKNFDEFSVRQKAEKIISENKNVWARMLAESEGDPAELEENRAKDLSRLIVERMGN
jgi:hypothetical protein